MTTRGRRKSPTVKKLAAAAPPPPPPVDIATGRAINRAAMRAAASVLLERAQFAATAGLTFPDGGGGFLRDLYAQLGYKRDLSPRDYWDRYTRGGIAERIIEAYPRATWIGGVELRENEDLSVMTPFETALDELDRRLDLWGRIMRADILAGLGRYAVLIIGARGALQQPLPQLKGQEDILYLTPLSEQRVKIDKLVESARDKRFGLPESYSVELKPNNQSVVHWTRVLHIAEGTLEDDLYGRPRLRSVWNYLDDLDKIVGGGAEASWKRMDPGMQLDIDPTIELTADDEAALTDEVDEYVHGLRRVMRTRGADLKLLNALPSPFGTNIEAILQLIGAATGIPQRILSGSERGELASQQDRENWNDRVAERRREFAEPLVKRLVERLVEFGALPEPAGSAFEYEIRWPEAEELSEAEKAGVASTLASANASQKASEGSVIMTASEIRDRILGLEPLEPEEATGEEFMPEEPEELPEDGSPFGEDDADEQGAGDDAEDAAEEPGGIDQEKPVRRAAVDGAAVARAAARRADLRSGAAAYSAAERSAAAILTAGDRAAPAVAGALWALWTRAAAAVDPAALAAAAATRNRPGIERAVLAAVNQAAYSSQASVVDTLVRAARSGGRTAAADLRRRPAPPTVVWRAAADGVEDPHDFNAQSPRILAAAAAAFAAITGRFGREVVESLRALLSWLLQPTAGVDSTVAAPPLPPARVAALVKATIGLRPDQVEQLIVFAESGRATPEAVERRARRMLRQRVKLIARTEAARAAAAGQKELWLQAQERGLLPPDQKRVWIATLDDRVRDAHAAMHGQVRGLQEPFIKPGGKLIEPGEEPNCRCGQALDFSEIGVAA